MLIEFTPCVNFGMEDSRFTKIMFGEQGRVVVGLGSWSVLIPTVTRRSTFEGYALRLGSMY